MAPDSRVMPLCWYQSVERNEIARGDFAFNIGIKEWKAIFGSIARASIEAPGTCHPR